MGTILKYTTTLRQLSRSLLPRSFAPRAIQGLSLLFQSDIQSDFSPYRRSNVRRARRGAAATMRAAKKSAPETHCARAGLSVGNVPKTGRRGGHGDLVLEEKSKKIKRERGGEKRNENVRAGIRSSRTHARRAQLKRQDQGEKRRAKRGEARRGKEEEEEEAETRGRGQLSERIHGQVPLFTRSPLNDSHEEEHNRLELASLVLSRSLFVAALYTPCNLTYVFGEEYARIIRRLRTRTCVCTHVGPLRPAVFLTSPLSDQDF